MIQANVSAAETLERARTPLVYRVHDEPSGGEAPRAARLPGDPRHLAAQGRARCAPERFNRFSTGSKGRTPRSSTRWCCAPRCRPTTPGEHRPFRPESAPLRPLHLADPPLRRPDRAPRPDPRAQARRRTACPSSEIVRTLGETAAKITAAERRAMAAERETIDRLIAHHLADRIGATFTGRITGVTRFGLFVKLDETGAATDSSSCSRVDSSRIFSRWRVTCASQAVIRKIIPKTSAGWNSP